MIENLKSRQQQEKSRLPKIQRSEAKTRLAIFKKSIRINSTVSSSEERERIKQVRSAENTHRPPSPIFQPFFRLNFVVLQFSLQEDKRQKTERQLQQQKHENQMRELVGQCEGNIRELQQLQVSAPLTSTRRP